MSFSIDTIKKVENTLAFQKMNIIQQKMVKKLANLKEINHDLNVIKNLGFEKWEKQSKVSYLNILIIRELQNERK